MGSPTLMWALVGEVDTTMVVVSLVNWQALSEAPPTSFSEGVSRMPKEDGKRYEVRMWYSD